MPGGLHVAVMYSSTLKRGRTYFCERFWLNNQTGCFPANGAYLGVNGKKIFLWYTPIQKLLLQWVSAKKTGQLVG